jgi:hypothetical protein
VLVEGFAHPAAFFGKVQLPICHTELDSSLFSLAQIMSGISNASEKLSIGWP